MTDGSDRLFRTLADRFGAFTAVAPKNCSPHLRSSATMRVIITDARAMLPVTLHDLLTFLLPFAQAMLADRGSFLPFGAGLTADRMITATPSLTDAPPRSAESILAALFTELVRQAASGEITAAGICTSVVVTLPGAELSVDAICLELEDSSGEAVEIFIPYTYNREALPEFGEAFVAAVESSIYVTRGDSETAIHLKLSMQRRTG
jgi:hypothetical protein